MSRKYNTIVIGGGAAGLMAAGQAALAGKQVLLLEKMNTPGRKLCITGKGRCNITNSAPVHEFIDKIYPNGKFLQSVFSQFFSDELIDFMNEIGVSTVLERGGRLFPENGKATDVTRKLTKWCVNSGAEIVTNCKTEELIISNNCIEGVKTTIGNKNRTYKANKVILATGGASYPATGSSGDGFRLAEKSGHTIRNVYPSLVPLVTKEKISASLSGLELKNVEVTLWIDNKKADCVFGELVFTDFGLSGPIVLHISRKTVPALASGKQVGITIDFKPGLDKKKLNNRLTRDFNNRGKEPLASILRGLMPKKLIDTCLFSTKLSKEKRGNQISSKERELIANWLKAFQLTINDYRPFTEAIVTAGGISTKEINQKTMESKIVGGLYFAGEIIDLDGPTGGYNLQIAFSTGWLAGKSS